MALQPQVPPRAEIIAVQSNVESGQPAQGVSRRDWQELKESVRPFLPLLVQSEIGKHGAPKTSYIVVNGSYFDVAVRGCVGAAEPLSTQIPPGSASGLQPGCAVAGLTVSGPRGGPCPSAEEWVPNGLPELSFKVGHAQDASGRWPMGPGGALGEIRLIPVPQRCLRVLLIAWSPPVSLRCMRIGEILQFLRDLPSGDTMRQAKERIVVPRTKVTQASYAETCGTCGPADIFISHSWDDEVGELERTMLSLEPTLRNMFGDNWCDLRAYFCLLTNNQHHIEDELGDDLVDGPFARVIRSPTCRAMVVAVGMRFLPFGRAWCLLELATALKAKKTVFLRTADGALEMGCMPIAKLQDLEKRTGEIDIRRAGCHTSEDLTRIVTGLKHHFGGDHAFNALIRGHVSDGVSTSITWIRCAEEIRDLTRSTATPFPPLIIGQNDFEISREVIGNGPYAVVHRGEFQGRPVAVKVFRGLTLEGAVDMHAEIKALGQLNGHPNIACVYGICTNPVSMITEFAPSSSLHRCLHCCSEAVDVTGILRGIAFGLFHMHTREPPLVHRDVKPSNVLIMDIGHTLAKICDFGCTRFKTLAAQNSGINHPVSMPQYKAPESYPVVGERPRFTTKSDVYSLGVVAWETATRRRPWEDYDTGDIKDMVLQGDRSGMPLRNIPGELQQLVELIEGCWAQEPTKRPDIIELLCKDSPLRLAGSSSAVERAGATAMPQTTSGRHGKAPLR